MASLDPSCSILCRYLCSTACGAEVLHIFGGLLSRLQHAPTIIDHDQGTSASSAHLERRMPLLFAVRPIGGVAERTSLSASVASPTAAVAPAAPQAVAPVLGFDDVALMDHILRYRLVTAVAFTAPYHFERVVELVSSPEHGELLASLSIDADLLDVSLLPSVSGTREERLQGLRRILPLLATALPVLQEADVFVVAAGDASVSTLWTTFLRPPSSTDPSATSDEGVQHDRRNVPLASSGLSSYPLDVNVYDVHAHLEDMHEYILLQCGN